MGGIPQAARTDKPAGFATKIRCIALFSPVKEGNKIVANHYGAKEKPLWNWLFRRAVKKTRRPTL